MNFHFCKKRAFTLTEIPVSIASVFILRAIIGFSNLPVAQDWYSVLTTSSNHSLVITPDQNFTEPRTAGVRRIQIRYTPGIDFNSVRPDNIEIRGRDDFGLMNLSGIQIQTSVRYESILQKDILQLDFSSALPDVACYKIDVIGLRDIRNRVIETSTRRFYSLKADVNKDKVTDAQDDSSAIITSQACVGSSICNPIVPNAAATQQLQLLRYDVNGDLNYNSTDRGLISAVVQSGQAVGFDHDVRTIVCP